MKFHWNDEEPIYVQLKNQICKMILEGDLSENETLPTIRQMATEYQINPAIVSKAWQSMLANNLIEKNANGKMIITKEAKRRIIEVDKEVFMNIEWPQVKTKIKNLEIDIEVLTNSLH